LKALSTGQVQPILPVSTSYLHFVW